MLFYTFAQLGIKMAILLFSGLIWIKDFILKFFLIKESKTGHLEMEEQYTEGCIKDGHEDQKIDLCK